MAKWTFEPGHTAAQFAARHMMVTWVRGHFKNVHGTLEFAHEDPRNAAVDVTIDARGLWTGEKDRDAHLASADFLDVENHPTITFRGSGVRLVGANEGKLQGDLTIRGVTRPVTLDVRYLESGRPLVGRRRRQGPEDAGGISRDHQDQPEGFWSELERYPGPRGTRRQRRDRHHDRRRGDPGGLTAIGKRLKRSEGKIHEIELDADAAPAAGFPFVAREEGGAVGPQVGWEEIGAKTRFACRQLTREEMVPNGRRSFPADASPGDLCDCPACLWPEEASGAREGFG